MTRDERQQLKEQVDGMRRERIRHEGRPKSSVARAAAMARRAQDALPIMAELVPEREPDLLRCQLCGSPAKKGVCRAHSDLVA